MALEGLRGFDYEEDITEARGTDVGVTDYLLDIPVGAVAGISQAVKGLLQLGCLLYTSPSPRDGLLSRMPSSA